MDSVLRNRRPQIADVARAAGVSCTTVSHGLSGKGRLSPETRARVRDVARRLGYRGSAAARHLAGGKSGLIAVQTADCGQGRVELADFEYFTELLNSVSSYALSQGYTVVVMPRVTQAGAKLMNGMPIDGAILIDPTTTDPNLQALERAHIPTIATSRSPDLGRSDYWVDVDYSAATVAVLDHLAAMGAERPALITSSPICWYSMESLSAYNSWMTGRGLQLITSVVSDSLTEGGGYGAAWELFEHDPRPDAIHATLDRLALGALLAAGAAGLRVPEDLLLSSLTDSRAARRAHPPLSAVDLKPARLGREAAGC